jgi:hypothetical protein
MKFDFTTDTATICIYDLDALKHRLNDDADWWSIEEDELEEVNQGNVCFVTIGSDGKYLVEIINSNTNNNLNFVRCNIKVPSGRVFIGAGEEVTSDGLEPECISGGTFINLKPNNYLVTLYRVNDYALSITFEPSKEKNNQFKGRLRL